MYPNYLTWIFNKDTKQPDSNKLPDFYFFDKHLDTLNSTKFKNKILVIDFWNSSCGACIRKFPDFEKVVKKYRDNDHVEFMCLNLKLERDSLGNLIKLTDRLGYKIPFYFTDDSISGFLTDTLNIGYVPHLMIYDMTGNLVYSGRLVTDKKIITGNIYYMIDDLMKQ